MHTHAHTHTHSLTRTLSQTLTHTLTQPLTNTHPYSLTRTITRTINAHSQPRYSPQSRAPAHTPDWQAWRMQRSGPGCPRQSPGALPCTRARRAPPSPILPSPILLLANRDLQLRDLFSARTQQYVCKNVCMNLCVYVHVCVCVCVCVCVGIVCVCVLYACVARRERRGSITESR